MKVTTEPLQLPVEDEPVEAVSAAVHRPSRPTGPAVLLTHGAGGDLDGAGLVALADAIAAEGHLVVRANLPFREAGKGRPPRADRSVPGLVQVATAARAAVAPRRPWVLSGKSYGGRVASMAVAEGLDCAGLVFYGYPLHPPGRPDRLRVDHWPLLTVPCLFLQGTRDAFCDLDLLDQNLRKLARRATVHVVEGGDHSLKVTGKASPDGQARSAAATCATLGTTVADWIDDLDA